MPRKRMLCYPASLCWSIIIQWRGYNTAYWNMYTASLCFVLLWLSQVDSWDLFVHTLQGGFIYAGAISPVPGDVIMGTIASQITSLAIVFSTVYLDTDQRKHQSSASLAFVRGIHRRPVNSPHKGPVTRKMFPFDDVIMEKLKITGKISCHRLQPNTVY